MSNKWIRKKSDYQGKLPSIRPYISKDGVEGLEMIYNRKTIAKVCFANMQTNYAVMERKRLEFVKRLENETQRSK